MIDLTDCHPKTENFKHVMKMTRSSSPSTQLPSGKYRCFLRDRRLTQTAVEAVFEVEKGPHAGKCLQGTFADAYRARKVSAIDSTTLVIVHVISKATRNGQRVTRIVDILPLHTRAEVTVLGGMPTGVDDGDEEFAPLEYRVDADVEEMHLDLYFLPTGQSFWAAPLVPEAMASDLYSSLTREPSENPFGKAEPFEPDRYWIGRTLKRIAADNPYALLTIGDSQPQPVVYEGAFSAYCRAEPSRDFTKPTRVSAFQYGTELVAHVRSHGGEVGGFRSPAWARWLPVMFSGGDGAEVALERCRLFVTALVRLNVQAAHVMIFTGGNGSLEVMVPAAYFGAFPRPGFEFVAGYAALVISDWSWFCDSGPEQARWSRYTPPEGRMEIAPDLYQPLAEITMPNTRIAGTNRYKVLISVDELASLDHGEIADLAREPRPFEPPPWLVVPYKHLNDVWRYAIAVAICRGQTVDQITLASRWVTPATFEFIRCGADPKECNDRLFQAAMNLLDFRCPLPLLEALLSPVALVSGMPVAQITRVLGNAMAKSKRARVMPMEEPPIWAPDDGCGGIEGGDDMEGGGYE